MADILILRLRPGRPVGTNTIRSSFQAAAIKLCARSLIHVKRRLEGIRRGTIHVPLSLLFEANAVSCASLVFLNGLRGVSAAEKSS